MSYPRKKGLFSVLKAPTEAMRAGPGSGTPAQEPVPAVPPCDFVAGAPLRYAGLAGPGTAPLGLSKRKRFYAFRGGGFLIE